MQNTIKILLCTAGLLLTACSVASTLTQKTLVTDDKAADGSKTEATAKTNKITWYDGKKQRTLWIAKDMVAEFPADQQFRQRSDLSRSGDNRLLREGPRLRLWKVTENGGSENASEIVSRGRSTSLSEHYSPVFRSAAGGGALKALPGGVIVVLNSELSQDVVDQWLATEELVVEKTLSLAKYAYFIQTEPGLASLELANRLMEAEANQGIVESASPNWWRDRTTR